MVIFVHGNPETAAVWGPLLRELGRDVVALSPPGFGAPVPAGFTATAAACAAWLVRELEAVGAPVDLVGHDWGGGHVLRVACSRPDLVRSWCSDVAGVFAPGYEWHAAAKVWQTPGAGEAAVAAMVAMPRAALARQYESMGMTAEVAREVADATDAEMGRCILALYRSAAEPARAWADLDLASARSRPGLVIVPTEDPYTGGEDRARWTAERMGAKVALLSGLGHWWMLQDPRRGAKVLLRFWRGAVR